MAAALCQHALAVWSQHIESTPFHGSSIRYYGYRADFSETGVEQTTKRISAISHTEGEGEGGALTISQLCFRE
jgi:hypothetical protein